MTLTQKLKLNCLFSPVIYYGGANHSKIQWLKQSFCYLSWFCGIKIQADLYWVILWLSCSVNQRYSVIRSWCLGRSRGSHIPGTQAGMMGRLSSAGITSRSTQMWQTQVAGISGWWLRTQEQVFQRTKGKQRGLVCPSLRSHTVSLPPYTVGQRGHKPSQIQEEGTYTPTSCWGMVK